MASASQSECLSKCFPLMCVGGQSDWAFLPDYEADSRVCVLGDYLPVISPDKRVLSRLGVMTDAFKLI